MKICMYIPTLNGGGAERVFVNLANYFAKNDLEVVLISTSRGVYGGELSSLVKFVPINNCKYRIKFFGKFVNILFTIRGLYKIIKLEKPDILFSTLAIANIFCYFIKTYFGSKLKLVTRQANVLNTASKNIFINYLLKKTFLSSNLVIANSLDTLNSILALCNYQIDKNKVVVIGNPVFTSEIFEKSNEILDLSFLKNEDYILNIGRFTKEKDHKTLLFAYKKILKKCKIDLILLGVGPLQKEIESLISDLEISDTVHIMGFKNNPYPYYKNAKLFLLTSYTEGFGNVLVEALAFGLPIVSSNCPGGPKFILNNGNLGTLVNVGDINMFADKVLKGIYETVDTTKLINRANDFSLDNIGKSYINELNNI